MKLKKKLIKLVSFACVMGVSMQVMSLDSLSSEKNAEIQQPSAQIQVTSNSDIEQQKAIKTFLQEAASFIKKHGKEKAFAEFNKKQGIFTKGDLYIYAMDYHGKLFVDPFTTKMLNRYEYDFQDVDGNYIVQDIIALAKKGGGWIHYRWQEPTTQAISCKKTYIMPIDNSYFIASGYYYAPHADGKCSP